MIRQIAKDIYDRHRKKEILRNNILDPTAIVREFTYMTESKIGYHSGINSRCDIHKATIGNYSQVGPRTMIGLRDHIYNNFMIGDEIYSFDELDGKIRVPEFGQYIVKIGSDVWIGGGGNNNSKM